ncbi:unnamed protein product [Rotaria sordida]|uniref:Lysozyme n=1 Tax=Rotaria sordida TaxID=392033 RepID=A0A819KRX8_9BILA|nr:unnamed protein product [Rotaria sordida]CAF1408810.1 unnamed protein product [Rotaria sordida]CAF1429202.1 unnamed protein product [Rotaria sordida]CAF1582763.1 unnamed protein product [Rotaria sordida]CAF3950699.1 unnamed protein product [Rotaria sordida]
MKLFLLAIFTLLITVNGNIFDRHCKCKAVASKVIHISYHSWDISSCKLCSCSNAAMVNCEQACKALVESYALTGCGKLTKNTKVKYAWEANKCSSGLSKNELTCA